MVPVHRWRPDARGALVGLTAATTRGHVVRAIGYGCFGGLCGQGGAHAAGPAGHSAQHTARACLLGAVAAPDVRVRMRHEAWHQSIRYVLCMRAFTAACDRCCLWYACRAGARHVGGDLLPSEGHACMHSCMHLPCYARAPGGRGCERVYMPGMQVHQRVRLMAAALHRMKAVQLNQSINQAMEPLHAATLRCWCHARMGAGA